MLLNAGVHGSLSSGLADLRLPLTLTQPQIFTNSGAGTLRFFATVDNSGHDLTLRVGAGTNIFAGTIGGDGGLVKEGAGTLRFVGVANNAYSGVTRVNEGTLELAKNSPSVTVLDLVIGDGMGGRDADVVRWINGNQIPDNFNVTVNGSGLLDLNGTVERIGALNGAGHVMLGSGALGLGINSGVSVFAGNIEGSGTIFKYNNGTQILSGTNSYTGLTLVLEGILQVDGFQPASLVQIDAAGRLQGSGIVGQIDITNSGSVLAPGASPGILTCSNYNADGIGNGTLQIELSGPAPGSGYDQMNVRGTVALSGITLNPSLNFASALSNPFVIVNNDGGDAVVGTFVGRAEGSSFAIGSEQFQITYTGGDGNDVVLTQVSGAPAMPRLEIERVSANAVRLLWPTNPPGFNLECNTNVASTHWIGAGPLPTVTGTNNVVTNSTSGDQKFYRLRKN